MVVARGPHEGPLYSHWTYRHTDRQTERVRSEGESEGEITRSCRTTKRRLRQQSKSRKYNGATPAIAREEPMQARVRLKNRESPASDIVSGEGYRKRSENEDV